MSGRRTIVLEDSGPTDVVTAAIVPMDGVTRLPVRSGVVVQLWDQNRDAAIPKRLIRNLSGHLVLVNEPADQLLTFRVDATAAGYRGPRFETFNPAADGVRRVVALEPAAGAALPANATVVRGLVVRSSRPRPLPGGDVEPTPEAGVTITAQLPDDVSGHQFPATTDDRGAFTLIVGLRPIVSSEGVEPARATIVFTGPGAPSRTAEIELQHNRAHAFAAPIDLDRSDRIVLAHQDQPEERDP